MTSRQRTLARPVVAIGVLLTAFVGCLGQKGPPERVEVSGTVKYQGKPLSGGRISFVSTKDPNMQDTAPIWADGTYSLTTAPLGEVKVTIIAGGAIDSIGLEKAGKKAAPPQVPPELNAKYSKLETTPLKIEIKPGPQENLDFEIK